MASDDTPVLQVPAREIPIPSGLSPEARAVLARGRAATGSGSEGGGGRFPAPDDKAGWRARIESQSALVEAAIASMPSNVAADVADLDFDGVTVYEGVAHQASADDGRVLVSLHGGALIAGGGLACRMTAGISAARSGVRTWAVDYRMPPDHPFPTPLDDCVVAYQALLRDHTPDQIIVSGGSAGGNLAAALVLRVRDEGLPMPAAVVLRTPEVDLTESGDTFHTLFGVDTVIGRLMGINLLYANGHDLAHPYLSPLFGDFTKGFPPTILTSGTRDLFLSNTVRMHRALRNAGVEAELHVIEAAPHGAFGGVAPEDQEVEREVARFMDEHWAGKETES